MSNEQDHPPTDNPTPPATPPGGATDDPWARELGLIAERMNRVRREIAKVYVGPDSIVEALMVTLISRGHLLIEGVPGIAKTTLVKTFAQTLDSTYRRIQFTPDLLPSDITGTYIFNRRDNSFELREGPIFANIVLGDEINRAPAKTQSALLEAMQESQVTIEGETCTLEAPFLVMATQNPVEQEGVYLLPEAQLDRFLIKIEMGYPSHEDELRILQTHARPVPPVHPVLTPEEVLRWAALAERVAVRPELMDYIVRLTRFTRENRQVALGASPRASIALMRAAKSRALLRGRDYIVVDDVKALAPIVLAHRILLHAEAELSGQTSHQIVSEALGKVRYAGN